MVNRFLNGCFGKAVMNIRIGTGLLGAIFSGLDIEKT